MFGALTVIQCPSLSVPTMDENHNGWMELWSQIWVWMPTLVLIKWCAIYLLAAGFPTCDTEGHVTKEPTEYAFKYARKGQEHLYPATSSKPIPPSL